MNRLGSIQRLRAIAALGVAVFHACQWSGLHFAVGAAGVDIFFVISGFVLWNAAEARPVGPLAFLTARLIRVAPLYWLATLAVAALVLWRPQAMSTAQLTSGHLILSLLVIPHNDPAGDAFPLLASGWTLTYEIFFYLAFATALTAPKARRWRVLSAILLLGSAAGFAYPALYPLLANPLLLEFLIGAGLARLWAAGRLSRLPAGSGSMGVAVGVAILALLQVFGVDSDLLRPLLWSIPAALIVGGFLVLEARGRLGRGRAWRAMEALGDASYSLYLCQLPIICVIGWLAHGAAPLVRVPLSLALAILAGLACHRLIEAPMTGALRRAASALARHRQSPLHRLGRHLRPAEQEALATVDADLA